jgi:hypothetical protein
MKSYRKYNSPAHRARAVSFTVPYAYINPHKFSGLAKDFEGLFLLVLLCLFCFKDMSLILQLSD